jgi:hypothetical protein
MYYPALLVMRSYKPLEIEEGMIFIDIGDDIRLFELRSVNSLEFIKKIGYPVEPYIVDPEINELEKSILAYPHQIAWFDEGESSDELRDITIEDMNYIINDCEGMLDIDIEEEGVEIHPLFREDKVVIRFKINNNE